MQALALLHLRLRGVNMPVWRWPISRGKAQAGACLLHKALVEDLQVAVGVRQASLLLLHSCRAPALPHQRQWISSRSVEDKQTALVAAMLERACSDICWPLCCSSRVRRAMSQPFCSALLCRLERLHSVRHAPQAAGDMWCSYVLLHGYQVGWCTPLQRHGLLLS